MKQFKQVVIWGFKLHQHTHGYIHASFHKAFTHLGYNTLWLDDKDNVDGMNFDDTLFLTEGQVCNAIPLNKHSIYILHNCYDPKFEQVKNIKIQTYTLDARKYNFTEIEPNILADYAGKCLYMMWGTDLLPHEIEVPVGKIINDSKYIGWSGTYGAGEFGNCNELDPFMRACKEDGKKWEHRCNISFEENKEFIYNSYLAPTITGTWQTQRHYIPCRAFKNVSYGQPLITNNLGVYNLFNQKGVYNPDTYQLYYDAKNYIQHMTLEQLVEQMVFVRDNHTYIDRINTLLDFINKII